MTVCTERDYQGQCVEVQRERLSVTVCREREREISSDSVQRCRERDDQ